ncbi:unnamed protein product [Kuraishia capsulata CBS 1993]|uniref:Uncharacterized protein n=1 Tax=Kuraishia capsulata CBS 1993 TaxID=1382522 RepID=W6MQB2_9ASCO|nr:uncharacterized protein KUCA_T00004920001 [Kuraishia capsulata CBS 1993]CDK28934.1 unnamed protein product [Kuraishia capsulata CBS 1993]
MSEDPKPLRSPQKTKYTLCVPSTCISRSNAANLEHATHVAYQIAKTAAMFDVGELVVLNVTEAVEDAVEIGKAGSKKVIFDSEAASSTGKGVETSSKDLSPETLTLALLLQFFVTPPYLRKLTFQKKHQRLFEYAKKLPKLSTLPFMQNGRAYDRYREGLTVPKHSPKVKRKTESGKTKNPKKLAVTRYVNVGTEELLKLDGKEVPVHVRVTVDINTKTIVSPVAAYGVVGANASFGYQVRVAKKFSSLFTESAYADGYTGTLYVNSGDYFGNSVPDMPSAKLETGADSRILVVVGKWKDISDAFLADRATLHGIGSASEMFDGELEIPKGSRVEDGCLISLSKLA